MRHFFRQTMFWVGLPLWATLLSTTVRAAVFTNYPFGTALSITDTNAGTSVLTLPAGSEILIGGHAVALTNFTGFLTAETDPVFGAAEPSVLTNIVQGAGTSVSGSGKTRTIAVDWTANPSNSVLQADIGNRYLASNPSGYIAGITLTNTSNAAGVVNGSGATWGVGTNTSTFLTAETDPVFVAAEPEILTNLVAGSSITITGSGKIRTINSIAGDVFLASNNFYNASSTNTFTSMVLSNGFLTHAAIDMNTHNVSGAGLVDAQDVTVGNEPVWASATAPSASTNALPSSGSRFLATDATYIYFGKSDIGGTGTNWVRVIWSGW